MIDHTLREVCAQTGMNHETIRKYHKLNGVGHKDNGVLKFTEDDIDKIMQIYGENKKNKGGMRFFT